MVRKLSSTIQQEIYKDWDQIAFKTETSFQLLRDFKGQEQKPIIFEEVQLKANDDQDTYQGKKV